MKRILLVLNRENREKPVMAAIQNQVRLIAPSAVVEIIPFNGNFIRRAAAFRPQVVMMFPLGSIGISNLVYLLKLRFGCRVVCFRAEGILDPTSPQSISSHTGFDRYGSRLVDAEIFWGPGPAGLIGSALIEQGKLADSRRIKCFGYPRLERYFQKSDVAPSGHLPRCAIERLDRYDRASVVLAITGFHFANYSVADLYRSGDLDAANRHGELLVLVRKVRQFRDQWKAAIRLSAASHPNLLFVLKKHPNEHDADYLDMESVPNVLVIADDIEFGDILERSGLLVHYGSTAAADAYITNVPTVYAYSNEAALREWFPHMGWPASLSIPITDLDLAIQKFVAKELSGEITEPVWRVLEWNFNIKPDVGYTPSKDIAAFLLANEQGQSIPIWDRYMWRSLFWYASVKIRQLCGSVVRHLGLKAA